MLKIFSNSIIVDVPSDITNGIFIVKKVGDTYKIAKRIIGVEGEGSLLTILEEYIKSNSSMVYRAIAHIIRFSNSKKRYEIIY